MYMLNIDRYLPFLVENNLSQQEYLLLHCLYFRKRFRDKYDKYIIMYKEQFPTDDGSMITKRGIEHLLKIDFLKRVGNGDTADDFDVTEKFEQEFINVFEAGNEIWDMYPSFYIDQIGTRYSLGLMDKNEFRNLYANAINYDRVEHEEVKKDLQYGIDNKLIVGKIEIFVRSEYWTRLRKERLKDVEKEEVITKKVKRF